MFGCLLTYFTFMLLIAVQRILKQGTYFVIDHWSGLFKWMKSKDRYKKTQCIALQLSAAALRDINFSERLMTWHYLQTYSKEEKNSIVCKGPRRKHTVRRHVRSTLLYIIIISVGV